MSEDENSVDKPLGEYLNLPEPGDRQNALLTGSQREFIYDPTSVAESSRSTVRQRLRDRIKAGFRDFEYLRAVLPGDLKTAIEGFEPKEQQHVITNMLSVVWHFARVAPEADFEAALERAIRIEPSGGSLGVRDVSVDINVDRYEPPDVDELKRKVEDDVKLTDEEIGFLVRLSDEDALEDVIEHARTPSEKTRDLE